MQICLHIHDQGFTSADRIIGYYRIFERRAKAEIILCAYGKCPKNLNTKASDKMTYANSVDPDQTAHEGAV